jgi:hypothetical protein
MSTRAAGGLAWVLYGLAAVLAVGTIILALLNHTSLRDFVVYYAAVGPAVGLSSPLLGALILDRYPDNRVGWVLCALGVGAAAVLFASEYARYALVTRPGALPGGAVIGWMYNWGWMPFFGLMPLLFLLFPDGRLRSRAWRPAGWVAGVTLAVPAAVVAVVTWQYRGLYLMSGDEMLPPTAPHFSLVETVEGAYFIALTVLIAAGVTSVFTRLRHAVGIERQQVKSLLYGGGIAVAITAVTTVFPTLETGVTALLTLAALLSTIAVAIFRYRLYDVDRVINRTLVYAGLTGILGVTYAIAVLILGQIAGQQRSSLAVAGATLIVAALFRPVQRRIQDQVDRRFNRRRYDATRTIQMFSARLRQEIDLATLTVDLRTVVTKTMEPTMVSLWLRGDTGR